MMGPGLDLRPTNWFSTYAPGRRPVGSNSIKSKAATARVAAIFLSGANRSGFYGEIGFIGRISLFPGLALA